MLTKMLTKILTYYLPMVETWESKSSHNDTLPKDRLDESTLLAVDISYYGSRSSKMKRLVKWESKRLITLGSITSIVSGID